MSPGQRAVATSLGMPSTLPVTSRSPRARWLAWRRGALAVLLPTRHGRHGATHRGGPGRVGAHPRSVPQRDRVPPDRRRRQASAAGAHRGRRPGGAGRPIPSFRERSVQGGIACELVQTGSLYHDDVMDEANTRRGVDTVNAKWGNLQAILAGDFLLSRASEIAASLGTEVAGLLARTIGRLCEGQIEELRHTYNSARPESSYLASISGKTASLYATAARIGGIVAGFDRPTDRRPHRVRRGVRHGVPDRRRPARHHRHRRAARQARRARHGGGRVHAARVCARCRPAACRRWSCWRCSASRSTRPSATRRSRSSAPTAASPRRSRLPANGHQGRSRPATRCRPRRPPTPCALLPTALVASVDLPA